MFSRRKSKKVIRDIRSEIIAQEIDRSSQFSNDLMKWYMASLLLLNGGALVAMMRMPKLPTDMIQSLGWPFGVALFTTLLSGFFFALASGFVAAKLSGKVWKGEDFDEDGLELVLEKEVGLILLWLAGFLGSIVALGLFVYGCFNFIEIAQEQSIQGALGTVQNQ